MDLGAHDDLSAKKVGSLEVAEAEAAIRQTRVDGQRASEDRRVSKEIAEAKAAAETKVAEEHKDR